jgi:hypothetical protein
VNFGVIFLSQHVLTTVAGMYGGARIHECLSKIS